MKKMLLALATIACLSWPLHAERDQKYQLFEDWIALGYVTSVTDTGPMSMSFRVACDSKNAYASALRVLPKMGFFIQNKNDTPGAYGVTTDWKTKPVAGLGSALSGITGVRVRMVISTFGDSSQCQIEARADLEVCETTGTWRAESTPGLRDDIRQIVSSMLVRPLYGNYDELAPLFLEYTKGDVPVFSKQEAWTKLHLPGFKGFDEAPAVASAPPPVLETGPSLHGQIKFREIASIPGLRPLIVTLAEDESNQRSVQIDFGGTIANLTSPDCMVLSESVKTALRLKETLKPGDSELGKELTLGPVKLQVGAKVTSAKKPARMVLLSYTNSSGIFKIELTEDQAKTLAAAADRGSAFYQGREALR